jgi:hypothetical protein
MYVCTYVFIYVCTPCSNRFWGPTGILSIGAAGGHETNISVLTFLKVKNMHNHTFSAPHIFKTWYLIQHTDNFTYLSDVKYKIHTTCKMNEPHQNNKNAEL